MNMALTIDTLRLAEALEAAKGDPRKTARAVAEAFGGIDTSELATKTDLANLRTDLNIAMADLRSNVSTDLTSLEMRMLKHFYAAAIGMVGLTITLLKLLP